MFTGLVEALGTVTAREERGGGARLAIGTELGSLVVGESVAVDGVCLTVDALLQRGFAADASFETLARSTLGEARPGLSVHLERALRVGDRLGGHIVSGHVDAVGRLASRVKNGDALEVGFGFPPTLARYLAEKGSVTVSGVSLTVNRVSLDTFHVVLVPRTLVATKLGTLAVGAAVNLEVDILARYCERLLAAPGEASAGDADAAWMARLHAGGWA